MSKATTAIGGLERIQNTLKRQIASAERELRSWDGAIEAAAALRGKLAAYKQIKNQVDDILRNVHEIV